MVSEQSWLMKGVCLIWSRGLHFSPFLPDRGPTQGRGSIGIWNLAHSITDPRAEISGILVMVRCSSATFRGTTYWLVFVFLCPRYFVCACASFQMCSAYYQEKTNGIKERACVRWRPHCGAGVIHLSNAMLSCQVRGAHRVRNLTFCYIKNSNPPAPEQNNWSKFPPRGEWRSSNALQTLIT